MKIMSKDKNFSHRFSQINTDKNQMMKNKYQIN